MERETIATLSDFDIELAEQESKENESDKRNYIDEEINHYKSQAKILKENHFQKYQNELDKITQEYRDATGICLEEGKRLCREMVENHRREVEELEKEWIEAHEKMCRIDQANIESQLNVSKILANYSLFEEASKVRDNANRRKEDPIKSVEEIDQKFEERYRKMIRRHERDYALLHDQLRTYNTSTKYEAEEKKKRADKSKLAEDSRIPSVIISSVALQGIYSESKKAIIEEFSPRRSPKK